MSEPITTTRGDWARQQIRKVLRNARDKEKWRKVIRFRLWMPVALQVLLIAGLLWFTSSRFEGFLNQTNIFNILILALPLIMAAIAQTHAILVGYLDLSVGAMISFGVVAASFLIGAEATLGQIVIGAGAVLGAGVVLGLINAGLIRGVKIPSIIATLATLSILDGVSLSLRPTAQGIISADLVSFLTTSIGPIPVAFIVIVVGAVLLDLWLHASGSGLQVRAVGFDERSAKRGGISTNWLRVRALILASGLAAVASFFVMARSPIGNAQIGSAFALNSITAAVLGGASLAGGRATFIGSTVAAVLLALIITVLPFLGLSPADGMMIIGILVLIGVILFQVGDLKELVKRNFRRARRLVLGSNVQLQTEIPEFYPRGANVTVVPSGRKLIKGGTVLSMDPSIGDLAVGDVLIDGDQIVKVGTDIEAGTDIEVIDASGTIVMPGFVDTHRHAWKTLFRNLGGGGAGERPVGPAIYGPHYGSEDVYAATLAGLLGAAEAGITTVVDWADVLGEPAHAEAVARAHADSGLRTVLVRAMPSWLGDGSDDSAILEELTRSGSDSETTVAYGAIDPNRFKIDQVVTDWGRAREAGFRIHAHVGRDPAESGVVAELARRGVLGEDVTLVHCTHLSGADLDAVASSGARVSLTPSTEMAGGLGAPPLQAFIDRGVRPGLGVGNEVEAPGDLFAQMRSANSVQHATLFDLKLAGKAGVPNLLSTREVIRYGTIDSAQAAGLGAVTGSLTPGKKADIVVLRADRPNIAPINDPIGAVVWGMDTSNIDWVIVDGNIVMRHGELTADVARVRSLAVAAHRRVAAAAGMLAPTEESA